MPIHVQNSEFADNLVSFKNLDGNNCRVFQLIVRDLSVEDLNGSIVTGISKQRESTLVEANRPDRFAVEPHRLIRPVRQIQVVPEQTLVVTTDDQIVTTRMDIERRDPGKREEMSIPILQNNRGQHQNFRGTYHFAPG